MTPRRMAFQRLVELAVGSSVGYGTLVLSRSSSVDAEIRGFWAGVFACFAMWLVGFFMTPRKP